MQTHTQECLKVQADRAQWVAKWPTYCRICGGAGGFVHHGIRYYSDGSGEPDDYEPCSCTEQGICPRCGEKGLLRRIGADDIAEIAPPCTSCGWNDDDSLPPACICGPEY